MRKALLTDQTLCRAVREMEQGLVDVQLGGGIVKKRVPLPGRGKRGGARTLIATNHDDRWIFLVGFEKNERDDLTDEDIKSLQGLALDLLQWSPEELNRGLTEGALVEICHETKI